MSASSLSSKIDKAARLSAALALAAAFVVFTADRPTLAGCGGGGGGGGGHAQTPAPDESFQPKKMSPADRAKITKLIQEGKKDKSNQSIAKITQSAMDFRNQAQQLLDDLDKKGYDTDPEYESDVFKLKSEMSTGAKDGGHSLPTGVGPGTTAINQSK